MKILIVEDEPLYVGTLCILIDRLGHQLAGIADQAEEAVELFYKTEPDLLLVDVRLKGELDGIDFALQVNGHRRTPTIFITSLRDEATFQRAQASMPFAFILKPFDELHLQRTIQLVFGHKEQKQSTEKTVEGNRMIGDSFFVSVRNKLEKINFDQILYIEADGRYSNIYILPNRRLVVRQTLGELEEKLPPNRFFRTHRSFLIHLRYLQSLDFQDMVVWINGQSIPLSKRNKVELTNLLNRV